MTVRTIRSLIGSGSLAAALIGCGNPTGPVLQHPSLAVVDSVSIGNTPFAVAISRAGVVYVTQVSTASAARTELPDETFPTVAQVGDLPSQVRVSPNGRTVYVGNQDAGTITVVDVQTNQPVDTIAVVRSILTIGLSPDGRRLYALTDYHGVYVIDVATRSVIDSIAAAKTGDILTGVAFHPLLARMYVCARDAGTITTIDTRTNTVLKTDTIGGAHIQNVAVARDGSELYATDIQRSALIIATLQSGSTGARTAVLLGSGVVRNAFDVAVTPDDAQLYVSMLADGKVYVLNRAEHAVIDSIAIGGAPRYIWFDAVGANAVVANEFGWVTFVH
jgi:YVTN family beta-propeller protein